MATTDYERDRQARMDANRSKMAEMGIFHQKSILESFRVVKQPIVPNKPKAAMDQVPRYIKRIRVTESRRSARLAGGPAIFYSELDESEEAQALRRSTAQASLDLDDGPLLDLMERGGYHITDAPCSRGGEGASDAGMSQERMEAINTRRCASQGRGAVWDSHVGITCHFCRQKKLCGEPDCPRCQRRDVSQECVGKTSCSRCMSATGRFCRACLLIRYGEALEDALKNKSWLCPHCVEEEDPSCGWMCNSSICMKRRGMAPTGIAIYEAQERGFKSVGHYLQSQLAKRNVAKLPGKQAAADKAAAHAEEAEGSGTQEQPAVATQEAPTDTSAGTSASGPGPSRRGRGRPAAAAATAQDQHPSTSGAAAPASKATNTAAGCSSSQPALRRGRSAAPAGTASTDAPAASSPVPSAGAGTKKSGQVAKALGDVPLGARMTTKRTRIC